MKISECLVFVMEERPDRDKQLKAFVNITFDNCFTIRRLRIIQKHNGKNLIVSMPTRKLPDGTYKDICHPITKEFRGEIEKEVLAKYREKLNQ